MATDRLQRLQLAVDAYVAWRQASPPVPADAWLAKHADLRDLLEKMIDGVDAEPDESEPHVERFEGSHLGDYQILCRLGRGGMGTVFEAVQTSLGRHVALKVLHPQLARMPRAVTRFRTEARAAAGLRHDGIVPIFEVAEVDGYHLFSMELVEGVSLDQRLDRDDLGLGAAMSSRQRAAALVVACVAEALDHAHRNGLVHRDVKPQNILLADDGRVLLVDFGLAVPRGDGADGAPACEGTPRYMSPEQRMGASVGPATDIYACGLVLAELLSRCRPFDELTTSELMDASGRSVIPRIPEGVGDLAAICRRCLAEDPAARYGTAGALAADLRAYLDGRPVRAARPSWARRASLWVGRHRAITACLALAIGLAIAAPFALRGADDRSRAAADAEDAALRATHQLVQTLRQRLAADEQPEPGSDRQLAAAAELCREGLKRTADQPHLLRQFGSALLELVTVHRELGRASKCGELLGIIEASARGDGAAQRVLRARAGSYRATLAMQASAPDRETVVADALVRWAAVLNRDPADTAALVATGSLWLLEARRRAMDSEPITAIEEALGRASESFDREDVRRQLEPGYALLEGQVRTVKKDLAGARDSLERARTPTDTFPKNSAAWLDAWLHECQRRILLARVELASGQRERAAETLRAARSRLAAICERFPGDTTALRALAHASQALGRTYLLQRNYAAAFEAIGEACERFEALTESPWLEPCRSDFLDLSVCQTLRASCRLLDGDPDIASARSDYEASIRAQERLLARDPESASALSGLGASHGNLAALENQHGVAERAREHAHQAIVWQRKAVALQPRSSTYRTFLAIHYAQLAWALEALGDADAGVAAARSAIEHAPAKVHPVRLCCEACARIADAWSIAGRADEADDLRLEVVGWLATLGRSKIRGFAALLERPAFAGFASLPEFQALRQEGGR